MTLPIRVGSGLADCAFFAGDPDEAATAVRDHASSGAGGYMCLCNAHLFVEAERQPEVARALANAAVVFPDGWPVAWLLRRLGASRSKRVAGPDLMPTVVSSGRPAALRHFLFGSRPEVLMALSANLTRLFPGAMLVGSFSPPFSHERSTLEDALYAIQKSEPHIVWCALGAPKQELWMRENHEFLRPATLIGVGAAFDFLAGNKRRAPEPVQRIGLEWLHRLVSEPRRLSGRYVTTNTAFLAVAARHLRRKA